MLYKVSRVLHVRFSAVVTVPKRNCSIRAKVVPFCGSEQHAKEAFINWRTSSLLSPILPCKISSVQAVYLPFYTFKARLLRCDVLSGDRVIYENFTNNMIYDHADMPAQVYASTKYPRHHVMAVHGSHVRNAREFQPSDLHGDRYIDPFTMHKNLAVQLLNDTIREDQRKRAYKVANGYIDINVRVKVQVLRTLKVYLPCYIIEFPGFGVEGFANYQAVVGGVTGFVLFVFLIGERHNSFFKAYFISALALFPFLGPLSVIFSPIVAMFVILYPMLSAGHREMQRQGDYSKDKYAHSGGEFEDSTADWHKSDRMDYTEGRERQWSYENSKRKRRYRKQYEEYHKYSTNQNRRDFGGQGGRSSSSSAGYNSASADVGPAADPKGFYKILGLDPYNKQAITTKQLQAAFRKEAMKHHPDMFQDPAEKKKKTEVFKRINSAYQVLRNKDKRAMYDMTGHAK